MIRFLLLSVTVMTATSCATLPDGKLQMTPRIVSDFKSQKETAESLKWGRPIYVEVQAYPLLTRSGDILVRSTILMNVGREVMSLRKIVNPGGIDNSGEMH